MLNKVKQHYNVAHTSHVTPISFRFYRYRYEVLTGGWYWALQGRQGIEIYNNQGICINIIEGVGGNAS